MWSKKPTPVRRSPAPVPSSARPTRMSVSPVVRSISAVLLMSADCRECGLPSSVRAARSPPPVPRRRRPVRAPSARSIRTSVVVRRNWRGETARREPGRSGGREDVVRTGDVVAERGAGSRADEHASGGQDPRRQGSHRPSDQLEVLGRERLGELDRLLGVTHPYERGHGAGLGAGLDAPLERVQQLVRDRHADHQRAGAVLGLGQQVEREQLGIRAGVRDHHQVAGAGEAVDPHPRRQLALRLLHVQVAGADDHVDRGDRLGSERERRDRLRAPHPVHGRGARQVAGGEHRRIDIALGARRRAHHDLRHARDFRRHHAHHDGARVRRPASRHVHGGSPDRNAPDPDGVGPKSDGPVGLGVEGCARDLPHVGDRLLEPRADARVERVGRPGRLERVDAQRGGLGPAGVERPGVFADGPLASRLDAGDDLPHGFGHGLRRRDQRPQAGSRGLRRPTSLDSLTPHRGAPGSRRSPLP